MRYIDVLVSSIRVVQRFQDLTREEVSDLFQCVHLIAPKLEKYFNTTSLTIAIQVRELNRERERDIHTNAVLCSLN